MNQIVQRKKNSLSAFKPKEPSLLRKAEPSKPASTSQAKVPTQARKPSRAGEYKASGKTGRPPKKAGEKENNRVQVSFNEDDFEKLQKKAGLVPLGTYLKHHLKESGII